MEDKIKKNKLTARVDYCEYLVQMEIAQLAIAKKRLSTLSKIQELGPSQKEYLGWFIKIAEYELCLAVKAYEDAKKEADR